MLINTVGNSKASNRKRTLFMLINVIKSQLFKLVKYQLLVFTVFYSSQLIALEKSKVPSPSESLLPMLTGLLVILAVIFILASVFKRFSNFGLGSNNIKVIESQVIGNKEKLMIVQVQQQQFLIGVTGHTISQLGELNQTVMEPGGELKTNQSTNNHSSSKKKEFDISTLPFGNILTQLIKSPGKEGYSQKFGDSNKPGEPQKQSKTQREKA